MASTLSRKKERQVDQVSSMCAKTGTAGMLQPAYRMRYGCGGTRDALLVVGTLQV